ncbi:MAG: dihydroorotase family protein, partial [Candidatus Bathyarchaeota archaeon]
MLPGLIDSHVHLRDQGLTHKESFFSGTAAAAAGGVTTVIDMPNNKPVTMSSKALQERMEIAQSQSVVNVAFYSAFPRNSDEIYLIVEEGAVAFKLYLSQKIGGVNIEDDEALLQAFDKIRETKVPIAVHAEDRETIERGKRKLQEAGRIDVEAHLEARSPEAEMRAIQHTINLAEQTRAYVHLCHLSTAAGLNAIMDAKKDGFPITSEVTPHHLFLSPKH